MYEALFYLCATVHLLVVPDPTRAVVYTHTLSQSLDLLHAEERGGDEWRGHWKESRESATERGEGWSTDFSVWEQNTY